MDLRGFWVGLKAAIIASSCCSFPLALVLLFSTVGAGSMTAALKIPKYKIFFEVSGTMFLLATLYLTIKKKSGNKCEMIDIKRERMLIATSIISYIILTLLLIYLILPALSSWLFT